jgi:hypothetical protein
MAMLITNRESPKVKIVMGRVKISNIGFTAVLSTAKTIAASRAVT